MCVLLFNVFKHLLLKKTDVLVGKINFSETKFEQMHKLRRAKRDFGKTFIFALLFSVSQNILAKN